MSIAKITEDLLGEKKEKKEKKINVKFNRENVIDTVLLISIIITSVNIVYWTVPLFLTGVFLLKYTKKMINYYVKK